jgi:hypothetical protein
MSRGLVLSARKFTLRLPGEQSLIALSGYFPWLCRKKR